MRIEELSVGDWVRAKLAKWDYDSPEETEPMRIVCINNSEPKQAFADLIGGGMVKHSALIDDLHPIPLTPEILEKNGLCVVEEDADFSEYELFGSENFSIFHIKGTFHYRLETPQASVGCWNVHQLQHALRLVGIEKEIQV